MASERDAMSIGDFMFLAGVFVIAQQLFSPRRIAGSRNRGRATPHVSGLPLTPTQRAYELLGAQPSMTFEQLRDCYRRKIFAVHPDHGGQTRDAVRVNHAWRRVQNDHRARMHTSAGRRAYA